MACNTKVELEVPCLFFRFTQENFEVYLWVHYIRDVLVATHELEAYSQPLQSLLYQISQLLSSLSFVMNDDFYYPMQLSYGYLAALIG